MRRIITINPKGGCGKSTLATNLAAYYALDGAKVTLADLDPQGSSLDWLKKRHEDQPAVKGVAAFRDGLWNVDQESDVLILDTPARLRMQLDKLAAKADCMIVPVLPSPIDMQAVDVLLKQLRELDVVKSGQVSVGLVANRVKRNTVIFEKLEKFLAAQDLSYVTVLREAQNYIRAYTRGLGIFELPEYIAWPDWEQWQPLLRWLESPQQVNVASAAVKASVAAAAAASSAAASAVSPSPATVASAPEPAHA